MASAYFSSLATEDLWRHAEYLSRDKVDAAFEWVDSMQATCQFLADNRDIGRM